MVKVKVKVTGKCLKFLNAMVVQKNSENFIRRDRLTTILT